MKSIDSRNKEKASMFSQGKLSMGNIRRSIGLFKKLSTVDSPVTKEASDLKLYLDGIKRLQKRLGLQNEHTMHVLRSNSSTSSNDS